MSVLFFTYLQRHLKKIAPLIEVFKKKEWDYDLVIMTQEEMYLAEKLQLKYKMLDQFTNKSRVHDFDLGWGLEPLINAIDLLKPDLFITSEVNYILRNAIRYCRQQNITSLVIQHGTPNIYSLHAFSPFEGNFFAAWGKHSKDFLVDQGVDPKRIILTGGMNFDRILTFQFEKKDIATELKIDPSKKWVVFTTQGVGAGNKPCVQEIYDGLTEVARCSTKFTNTQFIFQVHPDQTVASVEAIINSVDNHRVIVTKYVDTEKLIAASDGLITFFSTTSLDAAILGKPILLINLSNEEYNLPLIKLGAAYQASGVEEIFLKLNKIICESESIENNLRKAALEINYMNDGNATNRIFQLCLDILGNS